MVRAFLNSQSCRNVETNPQARVIITQNINRKDQSNRLIISIRLIIRGIGDVKAIEVVAAIEFGKRIFLSKNDHNKKRMMNAKTIWEETKYLFYDKKQENLYCLYFDNKQKLIGKKLMFIGTINRIIVHPREIFKEAYLLSASSIVCIHNHPSGDVTPSREDKEFTKNLVEIGKIQGIPVVDHIIVSEDEYYSFYDSFDKF